MLPVFFQGPLYGSSDLQGDYAKLEARTANERSVEVVPPWEQCAYLPSSEEFGDEIRQQAERQIKESPPCKVFFATRAGCNIRFSDVTKVRLCQCGLTCQEVESALVLSKYRVNTGAVRYQRYYFVASLKINRWLETLTKQNGGSSSRSIDWSLDYDQLFEYCHPDRSEWQPAKSACSEVPQVLLDRRYVSFVDACPPHRPLPFIVFRREAFANDKVVQFLAEAMSVFCYTLNTARTDADKVSDLKMLFSPIKSHQSSCDETDEKATRLTAKELLERIKLAPGSFA